MSTNPKNKLLKNRQVIEEINRHRWIESERVGHDIGFDQASAEWLSKFSQAWMQYHMPKKKSPPVRNPKSSSKKKSSGIKTS